MISGNEWLAPMAESNGILIFVFTLLTMFLVRLLHVFYNTGKALRSTSMKPRSTLIVLGSGGHTAEMLNLLSVLQKDRFMPRYYVAAATDNMSLQKAQTFESSSNNAKETGNAQYMQIYRSREVGQSYITSVLTTLIAIVHAVWLMIKIRPQVILCNGPGTCIPLCGIAFVFKRQIMEAETISNVIDYHMNSIVEGDFQREINSTVVTRTEPSPMDVVEEIPPVVCGISTNNETSFTPTSTQEEIENLPSLHFNYTPGGSEQWMRRVEIDFTPKVGMFFNTMEDGLAFYRIYALACGFDVRLYTCGTLDKGAVTVKSIVCNRQGFRDMNRQLRRAAERTLCEVGSSNTVAETSKKQRQTKKNKLRRCGCQAKMRLRSCENGGYIVDQFREIHNHPLYSVKNREFQKLSRNLSLYHKKTIIDHSKVNIGPTKSFRIVKEYSNGYQNVGASLMEFKNFQWDVKCYIGDNDAAMFIGNFQKMAETKGLYFAYEVDDTKCLTRVFWADKEAKSNYLVYGDTISFDPTYGTNKYFMVFTPFTGVDHNKKSVTFAAGLLSFEDEESFTWMFQKFLEAMGGKEPQCIITDQDPAIKNACPAVFKTARHKFCMWHIMQKMNDKVGKTVSGDTDLMSKISSVVWDIDLEPEEFEEKWGNVISEHSLQDNSWLSYMFGIRERWIPAYFRDLPLGCLLRTTQRSESENSYFKRFENHFGTLVEFWMRFTSAMEQQRHTQRRIDTENEHTMPQTITPLKLEKHASVIYTHAVFSEFQEEVRQSVCSLGIAGFNKNGNIEYHDVDDGVTNKKYRVEYNADTKLTTCACKLFERRGFICRHILWVWAGRKMYSIPDVYILQRWTKKSYRPIVCNSSGKVDEDIDEADIRRVEISKAWSEIYATMGLLDTAPHKHIKQLTKVLRQFRESIADEHLPKTKDREMEDLLGCKATKDIDILPPNKAKNKGSGKRLTSAKEKGMKKTEKRKRRCGKCKRWTNHNSRTCTLPFAEKPPSDDEELSGTEEEESSDE